MDSSHAADDDPLVVGSICKHEHTITSRGVTRASKDFGVVASRPSPPKRNLQINCNALTNSNLCRDASFSINPMQSSPAKRPEACKAASGGGVAEAPFFAPRLFPRLLFGLTWKWNRILANLADNPSLGRVNKYYETIYNGLH